MSRRLSSGSITTLNHTSSDGKKLTLHQQELIRKKQSFIDTFPQYGTPYHVCRKLGIPFSTFRTWLQNDSEFADAYKLCKIIPGHLVERVAIRRALNPRNNADALRTFFLRKLLPEQYADADRTQIEITIQHVIVSHFVAAIQQIVPDNCPHCKTNLGLTERLAKELMALSERLGKSSGEMTDADQAVTGSPA